MPQSWIREATLLCRRYIALDAMKQKIFCRETSRLAGKDLRRIAERGIIIDWRQISQFT